MKRNFYKQNQFIVLGVVLFLLVVPLYFKLRYANLDAPDRGYAFLAGATAILKQEPFPLIQRTPPYSAFLALIGIIYGADTTQTVDEAREFGNTTYFPVAESFLQEKFLSLVTWVQLALWASSTFILALVLRRLNIAWQWILVAVVLCLLPAAWGAAGEVSDFTLGQFLLMLAIYPLSIALQKNVAFVPLLVSGLFFALFGLNRSTFQLLSPILMALLIFLCDKKYAYRFIIAFLLPWVIVIGGWSIRNYQNHGFWGVTGVSGVALSTKTTWFIDRMHEQYPQETVQFIYFRDEIYARNGITETVFWGDPASYWLMSNRDMSYAEANQYLLEFNLKAILHAPQNYLYTFLDSLLAFNTAEVRSDWSRLMSLLWIPLDLLTTGLFLFCSVLWFSFHLLPRLSSRFDHIEWNLQDTVILLGLLIYWYTAVISSAVDLGKAFHRSPVQFVLPLVILLVWDRIRDTNENTAAHPQELVQ